MKLRNQFLISIAIFGILLVLTSISLLFTLDQTDFLRDQEEIAQIIHTRAGDLSYISNNYLLYQQGSDLQLWQSTYGIVSDDLQRLKVFEPKQQVLLNNVNDDLMRLRSVFDNIVAFLETVPENQSISLLSEFQIMWNQMAVQNQAIEFHTQTLSESFNGQIDQLNSTIILLDAILLSIFGAYFTLNFFIIYRNTLNSISELQSGIEIIGSGIFDYSLNEDKKDEIGEISKSINQMSNNLKSVTASRTELEKEITERKKVEKELKRSQHDLMRAQSVGKLGNWRFDVQSNILLWSDEHYKIFGVPKGTPVTSERFLEIVHPEDRQYFNEMWNEGQNVEPYEIEFRIIVDGNVKWVRERAEPEFDKDGTLKGWFGTTQNITDLMDMRLKMEFYNKHLENLVEEKTKQLKDAEMLSAIGATAGMVGHDIRNPLQAIDGAVYLAKQEIESLPSDSSEGEVLRDILNIIEEQTHYVDHIVADLQDFAKKPILHLEKTNIEDLIIESISDSKIPENIEVHTIFQKDLRELMIDPVLLKRVAINLISNAAQAMPNGGTLSINVFGDNNATWINIKDTGVGISEENKPKIFTPLFTTKSKGQGFGLAACKKMVEAQGGEITFESEEGKGTTFTIKLPINMEINSQVNKKAF